MLRYFASKGTTIYEALVLGNKKSPFLYATLNTNSAELFIPAMGNLLHLFGNLLGIGFKVTLSTEVPLPVGQTVKVQFREANVHAAKFDLISEKFIPNIDNILINPIS
jgi:hypothetical protein